MGKMDDDCGMGFIDYCARDIIALCDSVKLGTKYMEFAFILSSPANHRSSFFWAFVFGARTVSSI
jgi:hypothetical protein